MLCFALLLALYINRHECTELLHTSLSPAQHATLYHSELCQRQAYLDTAHCQHLVKTVPLQVKCKKRLQATTRAVTYNEVASHVLGKVGQRIVEVLLILSQSGAHVPEIVLLAFPMPFPYAPPPSPPPPPAVALCPLCALHTSTCFHAQLACVTNNVDAQVVTRFAFAHRDAACVSICRPVLPCTVVPQF